MRFHDAINGFFFILLGLVVLLVSRTFPMMAGQEIGPASFPTVIGASLMIGGAMIGAIGLRHAQPMKLVTLDPGWRQPMHLATVAFCILGSLLLAINFEVIGFPIGALVLCTGILLLSGLRKPMLFVVVLVFIAVLTLVMTRLLYVPLPMGRFL